MNILVIYPYIPYPLDRGTFQRTFHLLQALAQDHKIDLLALSENGESMEHREVFESFCNKVTFVPFEHPQWPKLISDRLPQSTPSTVLHWRLPHIAQAIREQLAGGSYNLVHVCDIVMAQYFLDEHKDIPLSMDRSRVDLQFQLQRNAVMDGSLKDKALAWENMIKLWRFEKRVAKRTQLQVLCGPDDETFVRRRISDTVPLKVVANGVDLGFFNADQSSEPRAEKPTILFCGAMDYAPNVDALRWYFDTMHRALRSRIPELEVLIVGKSPEPEVLAYRNHAGVTVTGSVPDVRPYYKQAWLQMVPLRIGGGTRLKIVESLAIGTPVVSTMIGAQGLALEHGSNILLADDAESFVNQMATALSDVGLRESLRANGISTAKARFSWKSIGLEFSAAVAGVAQEASASPTLPASAKTEVPSLTASTQDGGWESCTVPVRRTVKQPASITDIQALPKENEWETAKVEGVPAIIARKRISMMNVPFDSVTMEATLERIGEMVAERSPSFIATANVDFLVQAKRDKELHGLLNRADMVVCDGTPLVWLSRLLGNALPERVAGSDLVPRLLAKAEKDDMSVFFLGGRDEVLDQAVRNVRNQHPNLRVVGAYSPPFAPLDAMDNDDICARVRAAKPDILLVSFGCPKQEKWIARNAKATGVPVSIGVGATIDFLAGAVKRAPRWMHGTGLEWIFRLAQEPRRLLKRYATDLVVFGMGALTELTRKFIPSRA